MMQRLLEAGLYQKPEQCESHKETVRYLGLIILTKGISMDEDKDETIRNWSRGMKMKNGRLNICFKVKQFPGFCKYDRRFIPKYSEKAEPLTRLTKKDEPFVWESEQQLAFETIITAFTMAPALRHFDPEREVIIETDVSDCVSAGLLSQQDDEGVLHPVAYYSKKHSLAEWNYDIYDTELMAIIKALEEWTPECEGAAYPLQLITDYENLEYFITKKLLNRRQARWSEFSILFDYEIIYRPGKANGKVDALTRRSGDFPEGGDERLSNMEQVVLKPHNLPGQWRILANGLSVQDHPSIVDLFDLEYEDDQLPNKILKAIREKDSFKEITVAECTEQDGQVLN